MAMDSASKGLLATPSVTCLDRPVPLDEDGLSSLQTIMSPMRSCAAETSSAEAASHRSSPPPLCCESEGDDDEFSNLMSPGSHSIDMDFRPTVSATEVPRPCVHNQWVKYGKKQGKIVLRCTEESCKRQWKIRPGTHAKCVDFYKSGCARGAQCPHPHIYARQGYLRTATTPHDGLARRTDWPPRPTGTVTGESTPCSPPTPQFSPVVEEAEQHAAPPPLQPLLHDRIHSPKDSLVLQQALARVATGCGIGIKTCVGVPISSPTLSPPMSPMLDAAALYAFNDSAPREAVSGWPKLAPAEVNGLQQHHRSEVVPVPSPTWLGDMVRDVEAAVGTSGNSHRRGAPPTTMAAPPAALKKLNVKAQSYSFCTLLQSWQPVGGRDWVSATTTTTNKGLNAGAAAFVPRRS
eukprot:TRINITY_DN1989_c2_g1_i22.p1 TRINITY_DN1989_c2_g1~~TRINITY_DN1989_c2_g1_i22.p1  ORF type:complete len:430 (+),score=138.76 TRINITY_DN1989_c2_g1_i22:74-1291(+)